jgi:hypothetical protein
LTPNDVAYRALYFGDVSLDRLAFRRALFTQDQSPVVSLLIARHT